MAWIGERRAGAADAGPVTAARRGDFAAALGIETKEDLNPDLAIRPTAGITVRLRDFS